MKGFIGSVRDGVMQFHATRNPRTNTDVNIIVRVLARRKMPPQRNPQPNCICEFGWPVVNESIGDDVIEAGGGRSGRRWVCSCMGEVIE